MVIKSILAAIASLNQDEKEQVFLKLKEKVDNVYIPFMETRKDLDGRLAENDKPPLTDDEWNRFVGAMDRDMRYIDDEYYGHFNDACNEARENFNDEESESNDTDYEESEEDNDEEEQITAAFCRAKTDNSYKAEVRVKYDAHKVVYAPASFWLEYAFKTKQNLQRCVFKSDDIQQYVESVCDTPCSCENDVYKATNTGFRSNQPVEVGYERHPYIQLKGGDYYVRCDSHMRKVFEM